MIGSIVFFISDNCLAHGKFDKAYTEVVSKMMSAILVMVTYYLAQFLIGKGTFLVAVHYSE